MKVHLAHEREMYHYFACVLVSKFKYLNCRLLVVPIEEPIISCLSTSMPCHLFVGFSHIFVRNLVVNQLLLSSGTTGFCTVIRFIMGNHINRKC